MLRQAGDCFRLLLPCLVLAIEGGTSAYAEQPLNELGTVELVSVLDEGGEPFPGTEFSLVREGSEATAQQPTSVTSQGVYDQVRFTMPAGRYLAVARNGSARVEREVIVAAGKTNTYHLSLGAGQVKLSLVDRAGGNVLHGTRFKVWRVPSGGQGGCRKLVAAEEQAITATFTLPAGSYVAMAGNSMRAGEVSFHIRPLQAQAIEIIADNDSQIATALPP